MMKVISIVIHSIHDYQKFKEQRNKIVGLMRKEHLTMEKYKYKSI